MAGKAKVFDRSTDGLRESLFAAIEAVHAGAMSAPEATAVSRLAQSVIASAKLDLEARAALTQDGDADADAFTIRAPALRLGSGNGKDD